MVEEAIERGWDRLVNGDLIAAAEAVCFDVLLTTDKNMRYQRNLQGRRIAFVVPSNQQWPVLRHHNDKVAEALAAAGPAVTSKIVIPIGIIAYRLPAARIAILSCP